MEQWKWNSDTEIVRWNTKTVFVEQCGGTVEQCWWNSVMEQWNRVGGTVEEWNSVGGRVEQCLWNSGTVKVEQCGDTVE